MTTKPIENIDKTNDIVEIQNELSVKYERQKIVNEAFFSYLKEKELQWFDQLQWNEIITWKDNWNNLQIDAFSEVDRKVIARSFVIWKNRKIISKTMTEYYLNTMNVADAWELNKQITNNQKSFKDTLIADEKNRTNWMQGSNPQSAELAQYLEQKYKWSIDAMLVELVKKIEWKNERFAL